MIKTIYFDMDGVLADFDKAVKNSRAGVTPWLTIKKFFADLKPIGNPEKTLNALISLGYEVKILSKVETRDTEERAKDKIEWIKKHLPSFPLENVIIVPNHLQKIAYIQSKIEESVLVDDYKGNLIEWQNAGGIAVKFGNKLKNTRPYYQIEKDISNLLPLLEELKRAE